LPTPDDSRRRPPGHTSVDGQAAVFHRMVPPVGPFFGRSRSRAGRISATSRRRPAGLPHPGPLRRLGDLRVPADVRLGAEPLHNPRVRCSSLRPGEPWSAEDDVAALRPVRSPGPPRPVGGGNSPGRRPLPPPLSRLLRAPRSPGSAM
jgi:hypothetical protein